MLVSLRIRKLFMVKKEFYIYKFIDNKLNEPFYIGKGKNDRWRMHFRLARKGIDSPLCNRIRELNYEKNIEVFFVEQDLDEHRALSGESRLIEKIGRRDLGEGPLLNRSKGGEGLSGGIDKYGYKRQGIARKITDMLDEGMFIEDMPDEIIKYVSAR